MSLLFKSEQTGKNFTISRRNGRVESAETPITFQGNIQPLSSREIAALTSGRLSTGMVRVFSETALVISEEGSSSKGKGTHVLFKGKWYECVSEADWDLDILELQEIDHFEYTAEYRGVNGA